MPPIPPIKGMLLRSALTNITIGLSSGIIAGCYFWYGIRGNEVRVRDEYYAKLQRERDGIKA
ncbi:hypothetical protein BCR35DRAFT_297898 [Leucosporidium creatinivorum]|uniref:Cytochrome c oxidase polypeptide VIIA n=1 Tax=Leucosporidium creatinivorum TaxID=106004 RepID=A0A1Y2G3D8_9BASI|nr:hypothetical protein BCR35DRAFT_297898 [Leucosporidium creatinivorum]